MPSPMSGTLTTWIAISGPHRALERLADSIRTGKIGPLLRVRIGRVPTSHALDRRLEVKKAMLLHQRRELGAEATGARGLMDDHTAARLLHGGDNRVQVERP